MKLVLYLLVPLLGTVVAASHEDREIGRGSYGHPWHDRVSAQTRHHRDSHRGAGELDQRLEEIKNWVPKHMEFPLCPPDPRSSQKAIVFNTERYGTWSDWSECLKDSCIEIRYRACTDDSWEVPSPNPLHTTKCISKFYVEKRTCSNKTTCTSPVILANCGVRPNVERLKPRVVGGNPVEPHTWPWAVRLSLAMGRQKSKTFCGGTLISPRWVLTAAHCLMIENNRIPAGKLVTLADYMRFNVIAHLGDHHQRVEEDSQKDYHVVKAIIHPKFRMRRISEGMDIALLYLSSAAEITPQISYACLPPRKDLELTPGTKCYALGWGKQNAPSSFDSLHDYIQSVFGQMDIMFPISRPFFWHTMPFHHHRRRRPRPDRSPRGHSTFSDELQEVELPIVGLSQCRQYFGETVGEFHICAGAKGKDTCSGDSGGGLYCQLPGSDSWYVMGITSFGATEQCGSAPGVSTSVPAHLDWVSKMIASSTY